jgi:hypothetical protein
VKFRVTVLGLLLGALSSAAHAQTLSDLEKRYGAPVRAYSASEHIWVTPEFGDDGQLCMARLYPKQIDAGNNYLWDSLPLWEVKEVLDQLAPANVRGKKKGDRGFFFIGGVVFSGFDYENVRIDFTSTSPSRKPNRAVRAAPMADDDEFPGQFARSAQIVTISWLNRKCAAR